MRSQVNPRFVVIAQKEAKAKQEASSKQESGTAGSICRASRRGRVKRGGYNQQAPQNYQPPAPAPAPQPQTGGGSSGYQLQPYEKYFDKNDVNADGTITGGGDEDGNVWHDW